MLQLFTPHSGRTLHTYSCYGMGDTSKQARNHIRSSCLYLLLPSCPASVGLGSSRCIIPHQFLSVGQLHSFGIPTDSSHRPSRGVLSDKPQLRRQMLPALPPKIRRRPTERPTALVTSFGPFV